MSSEIVSVINFIIYSAFRLDAGVAIKNVIRKNVLISSSCMRLTSRVSSKSADLTS